MPNTNLLSDLSFYTRLSTEDAPPTNLRNGAVYLEVDTRTWYVLHNGTWYAQ